MPMSLGHRASPKPPSSLGTVPSGTQSRDVCVATATARLPWRALSSIGRAPAAVPGPRPCVAQQDRVQLVTGRPVRPAL